MSRDSFMYYFGVVVGMFVVLVLQMLDLYLRRKR